ncbi:MAG: 50S ribosomal protein L2 [Parcubacteria group bacterium GW2011_GWB1_41_4]|nr:MAG: 50S ribosomal protein L2 [Parcubacteria group bacterium GW2011_GWB1_41_4]
MAIKISKPTSAGRRHSQVVDYSSLSKTKPYKPLLAEIRKTGGRYNTGRITMRHQGGGVKRMYRVMEFGQGFLGKMDSRKAKVETVEYDPNRTAFISLVLLDNGRRLYILTSAGVKPGDVIEIAGKAELKLGNRMRLKNIPVGTQVHNIELRPDQKGKLVRSAGSFATVMAHEGRYAILKMPSSEVRRVDVESFASIGQVSNFERRLVSWGKAGRSRLRGIRPTVRAKAMNPRDHPYGGGEGKTTRGTKRPKDKWGNITGGRKTRNKKKYSKKLVLQRRVKPRKQK